MTADLVFRLRDADMGDDHSTQKLLMEGAAEIERLRRDIEIQTVNATAVLQAQHERDCAVEKLVHMSDLLTRARYGFVQHLCHNGKMGGGLSCLACEITAALQGTRTREHE